MILKNALPGLFILSVAALKAQIPGEQETIKKFCGCFEVEFEYAETFPRVEGYTIAKPYHATALEYIVLEEEAPGKLVMQHLLALDDSMVIKHWRQDWEYEPSHLFTYHGNETWSSATATKSVVHGAWSQKVFQVDDTPRYSGTATWQMRDGKYVWVSTSDAPLPRREYTKRDDYQVLRRTNTLIIEEDGWIHEQDNAKIVIDTDREYSIVEEKGRNTYRRVDPAKCAFAAQYWEQQKAFWVHVRAVWDEWLMAGGTYTFIKEKDGDQLRYELQDLMRNANDVGDLRAEVRTVLSKYRSVSTAAR